MLSHQKPLLSSLLLFSVTCWSNVIAFSPSPSIPVVHSTRPVSMNIRRRPSIITASPFCHQVFTGQCMFQQPMVKENTTPITTMLMTVGGDDFDPEDCPLPPEGLSKEGRLNTQSLLIAATAIFSLGLVGLYTLGGLTPQDAVQFVENLIANPQDTLQNVVDYVQDMGPAGALYFGVIYLVAEILAVPATPLTLSAGYLFGLTKGVAIVLTAASIAASFAFVVGKTVLRCWVEDILEQKPEFAKIDKAIGREGFKLLLLVRLSPIFPFALSNYLYGASSIDFASYFWGTVLGFAPGTIAYVYTGMVGQALTLGGEGAQQPWYVYAAGFGALLTFLKLVTDVATEIVNAIDDDDDDDVDEDGIKVKFPAEALERSFP